eukprot:scaffold4756_cov116-Isochrysis_galbana.AAC.6
MSRADREPTRQHMRGGDTQRARSCTAPNSQGDSCTILRSKHRRGQQQVQRGNVGSFLVGAATEHATLGNAAMHACSLRGGIAHRPSPCAGPAARAFYRLRLHCRRRQHGPHGDGRISRWQRVCQGCGDHQPGGRGDAAAGSRRPGCRRAWPGADVLAAGGRRTQGR